MQPEIIRVSFVCSKWWSLQSAFIEEIEVEREDVLVYFM